jgi:hypothetical protein
MKMSDFWQWKGDAAIGGGYVVLPKGSVSQVITATITATLTGATTYTSAETNIAGFNSALLETTVDAPKATAVIAGAMSSGGTMVAVYDKDTSAQMTTGALTSSRTLCFTGLPDYLGVSLFFSAGITAGSSATVKVLPLNM